MAIDTTAKGILDFLRANDDLVKDIGATAGDGGAVIAKLADRVEASRKEAQVLVDKLGTLEFDLAKAPDIRAQQAAILARIENLGQRIQAFLDSPEITTPLYASLATEYVALANTYNECVREIVPFTAAEVEALKALLRQATLDAARRQRLADILDAAVQLGKLGLRVATKVAAA